MDASDCGSDGSDGLTAESPIEIDGQVANPIHPDGTKKGDRGETGPGVTLSKGLTGSHPSLAAVVKDGVTSGPGGANPAPPEGKRSLKTPTAEAEKKGDGATSGPTKANPEPDQRKGGPNPKGLTEKPLRAEPAKAKKKGEGGPISLPSTSTSKNNEWPLLIPKNNEGPSMTKSWAVTAATKDPATPTAAAWRPTNERQNPEKHRKAREETFKDLINGNELLPRLDFCQKISPRVLSLVSTNSSTKRLIGLKREELIDVLIASNFPAKYVYQRSFATWDVLLPTEEEAVRRAVRDLTFQNVRLQPEYLGCRRTKVKVFGIPPTLEPDHVAAYLSEFGDVEAMSPLYGKSGIQVSDYAFTLNLRREMFDAIPDTIQFMKHRLTVVVEGRKPHCRACGKQGHLARNCPERSQSANAAARVPVTRPAGTINKGKAATKSPATKTPTEPATGTGEGWSVVAKKGKQNPYSDTTAASDSPVITHTTEEQERMEEGDVRESSSSQKRRNESVERDDSMKKTKIEESQPIPPQQETAESGTHTPKKKKEKSKTPKTQSQPDDTSTPATPTPTPTTSTPTTPKKSKAPATPKKAESEIPLPSDIFNLASPSPSPSPSPSKSTESPEYQRRTSRGRRLSALSRRRKNKDLLFLEGEKCCEIWHASPSNELTQPQRTALRPLEDLEEIEGKRVDDPRNFRSAPMVTTFIREAEGRYMTGAWAMVKAAELAFPNIRMADREHSSLKHLRSFCSGRAPVYVHPSLYRALKVLYPLHVGGITRTNRVTVGLGRGSMGQFVGELTATDFRSVADTE